MDESIDLCYDNFMKKQKVFVIGGPTASGKSSLAIRLAEALDGCVANGDAIQVYKDLQVLSARPSKEETRHIPHYLYGEVDAYTNFSVTDWLARIKEIVPNLKNPVIVGGTGLYLNALLEGISPIPDVDAEVRQKVRAMPLNEVKSLVKDCPYKDPQRLRRALEVQLSTGKTLASFYDLPKVRFLDADFCLIHILPPRDLVYENCEKRFHQMVDQGAIKEVQHLLDIKATGGVLKAIGVPEIQSFLKGEIAKTEMIDRAIIATRQYAKRQMTWFRHHGAPDHLITDISHIKIDEITK